MRSLRILGRGFLPFPSGEPGIACRSVGAVALALLAVVIAFAVAFTSTRPEGLGWVAQGLGFAGGAERAGLVPLSGYEPSMAHDSFLSSFIAGFIGAASAFTVVYLIGRGVSGLFRQRAIRHQA